MPSEINVLQGWADWVGDAGAAARPEVQRAADGAPELRTIAKGLRTSPAADVRGEDWLSCGVDDAFSALSARVGVVPRPFWPKKEPYALCATHDIDRIVATYQRLRGGSGALARVAHDISTAMIPGLRGRNPFFNFERLAEIEGELDIRSACYVLFERRRLGRAFKRLEPQHWLGVYRPQEIAEELRQYARTGNEVGLHLSFDSWADGAVLARELANLRSFGIEGVEGARTHYLQWDEELSPRAQAENALAYDSSLGFNFTAGFRGGTAFPFRLANGHWELPFQLMDTALRAAAESARGRERICDEVLAEVRRTGGVLVLNWHTQVMNAEAFPEMVALFRRIVVAARRDGAWITLPRELIRHWRKRGIA